MTDLELELLYRKLVKSEIILAMTESAEILQDIHRKDKIMGKIEREHQIALAGLILQQINFIRQWQGE
jgi:hypothetical protein